jgi:hypothetical protein
MPPPANNPKKKEKTISKTKGQSLMMMTEGYENKYQQKNKTGWIYVKCGSRISLSLLSFKPSLSPFSSSLPHSFAHTQTQPILNLRSSIFNPNLPRRSTRPSFLHPSLKIPLSPNQSKTKQNKITTTTRPNKDTIIQPTTNSQPTNQNKAKKQKEFVVHPHARAQTKTREAEHKKKKQKVQLHVSTATQSPSPLSFSRPREKGANHQNLTGPSTRNPTPTANGPRRMISPASAGAAGVCPDSTRRPCCGPMTPPRRGG